MIVIDLFSGGGGLSEGFHENGFKIVAQVEKDQWACETLRTRMIYHYLKSNNDLNLYFDYLKNRRSYRTINQDRKIISDKYPELVELLDHVVLNKKFGNPASDPHATSTKDIIQLINKSLKYHNENSVNVIIGGPPCQAYSLVGRSRMKEQAEKDPRNYLFFYYLTIVKEYQPEVFIFENVPGLLNAKSGLVFEKIKEEFELAGYKLASGIEKEDQKNVIDFANYGIPQRRKRVLLFGIRRGLNIGYPVFEKYKYNWTKTLTVRDVISDLPALHPGQGDDYKITEYALPASCNPFQEELRKNSIGVINHKARNLQDRDREIYKLAINAAKNGMQLKYPDLPAYLKTHNNEQSFLDRFKVHWWNNTPHTVVAHIAKDGHYNIHPDIIQTRSLTVREAARIQTFNDNHVFEGPRTAQYIQVGNAVPPMMSKIIAKAIKDQMLLLISANADHSLVTHS
jgi:DNA (cytosine-5)-methyltransferase 1